MRVFLMVIACAVLCVVAPRSGAATENEIAVTGNAVTYVASEYATVNISISSLSKKAKEATLQTAELHQRVLVALREIDAVDIHTLDYRVSAKWKRDDRGQPEKFQGYEAVHNVAVKLEDVESVGEVVDVAIQAGAKNVGSIRFHADVTDSLRQATLTAAVRQARRHAETIAAAAGGSLGELIELATQDAARAMRKEVQASMSACQVSIGTRITPGAQQVRVVVLARWKFIEGAD